MANVIGVRFQNAGKLYFFDPGAHWPTPGDFVIVETARGIEFGEVVTGVRELNDEQLSAPLKQVVRVATAQDVQHARDNQRNEKEAYGICQRKIAEHKLDMKLVSVEYTFDNSKILFYFTANGRVDFRSLVKDLASVFKTRIELRQIGVRDEAKMLGGLGPCGRPICCGTFLGDFQPVSIKMAKEQSLSLNPTKISGVCGRLMCCLKYEEENYEEARKRLPRVGKEVITPDGKGVVWDLNVIKETVRVRVQHGDSSELKDFPASDVQRVGIPVPVRQPVVNTTEAAADAAPTETPAAQPDEVDAVKPFESRKPVNRGEQPRRNAQPRPPRQRNQGNAPFAPKEVVEGKEQPVRLAKPVQRENPNRRGQSRGAMKQGMQRERRGNPVPVKNNTTQVGTQPQQGAKVSPWKAAVEKALREARGDELDEKVEHNTISLEDHQDTYVFVNDNDDDDTI